MCMFEVDDVASVFVSSFPKAAKDHVCSVCETVIPRGEVYLRHKMLFDGEWSGSSTCKDCAAVWTYFLDVHSSAYGPSDLGDMVEECIQGVLNEETRIWRVARLGIDRRIRLARAARMQLAA